jgi:hypothetical protein
MPGPMKPSEVRAAKKAALPEEVFRVVNRLIEEHWNGNEARFGQNRLVSALMLAMSIDRHEVFSRHLLDFEEAYRAQGWEVEYDKPGYNETYEPTFSFSRGKPKHQWGPDEVCRVCRVRRSWYFGGRGLRYYNEHGGALGNRVPPCVCASRPKMLPQSSGDAAKE